MRWFVDFKWDDDGRLLQPYLLLFLLLCCFWKTVLQILKDKLVPDLSKLPLLQVLRNCNTHDTRSCWLSTSASSGAIQQCSLSSLCHRRKLQATSHIYSQYLQTSLYSTSRSCVKSTIGTDILQLDIVPMRWPPNLCQVDPRARQEPCYIPQKFSDRHEGWNSVETGFIGGRTVRSAWARGYLRCHSGPGPIPAVHWERWLNRYPDTTQLRAT